MKKYTLLAALAFSALTVTATPKENTSQGNPQEMDKFITELMGKMTPVSYTHLTLPTKLEV